MTAVSSFVLAEKKQDPMRIALTLCCFLPVLLIGCSNKDTDGTSALAVGGEDSAEAAARRIRDAMNDGEPVVAWDALPASYQADANELIQTFGKNMDAETWNQVAGLLRTVHKVLDTKQEFIMNHPNVAESDDPAAAKKGVIGAAGLLKTLLDNVGDLKSLQTFDGRTFAEGPGADIAKQINALKALAGDKLPGAPIGPGSAFSASIGKITTVSSTDTTATIKITDEDGSSEQEEFVKHDGKWLPKSMVADWDQQMAAAREALAKLPENSQDMRMKVMMAGGMVAGILAPLENAATQEQFNTGIENLKGTAGMLFGSMMGSPGPPMATPVDAGSPGPPKVTEPQPELAK